MTLRHSSGGKMDLCLVRRVSGCALVALAFAGADFAGRSLPCHRVKNFRRPHPCFWPRHAGLVRLRAGADEPAIPKTHKPYTIEKDGFRATYYEMAGQYGTHIDPPAHFTQDGITMDKIPLEEMILPLVVFDATPYLAADPNHAFSLKDLRAGEEQNGRVPGGAFAALRTDMSKEFEKDPESTTLVCQRSIGRQSDGDRYLFPQRSVKGSAGR
jgi:hypothetical protein